MNLPFFCSQLRRPLSLLLVLWLVSGTQLFARTTGSDPTSDPASTDEPEVILFETATVKARALESSGSAIEVIDATVIGQRGASDLAQLLRGSPGVFAVSGARSTQTPLQLRGGDPNFALVLFDGVPLNDSTDSLGGAVDLTTIGVSNVERVELVRGSSSWFYGSSALSGVLQVITRDPDGFRFTLAAGAGDFGQLASSLGVDGSVSQKVSLGFALGHDEEEGRVSDRLGVADRFSQDHGLLRLFSQPSDRLAVRASVRVAQTEKADWGEGSGGPDLGSGEVRLSDQQQVSAALSVDFGGEVFQQLLFTLSDQDLERVSPAIVPVVPPSMEDTNYQHTRAAWRLQVPVTSWLLGGGAEASKEEGRTRSLLLLPDFFGGPLAGDYDADRAQGALFLEAIHKQSGDLGELTLELGSRVDLTESANEQFSPRLGLSFAPPELPLRVRGSFGRSFKLPSFYALSSPRALGGNSELRPETATGGDLGVELDLAGGDVSIGLGAFSTRYENLVDFDFNTFQLINRSQVDARGLEAQLAWRMTKRWSLRVNATAQEVEDGAGMKLLRRPDWYGGAQLFFRPESPLDLVLELETVGDAVDEQVPVGRNRLGGYEILNLAGSYRLNDRLGLRVRLDNVFDQQYETQLGFPGPGLTLFAGIRFER